MCVPEFQMESPSFVITSFRKGEFLAQLDLQDAFFQIPSFLSHQDFLCFALGDQLFRFWHCHSDSLLQPKVFTKVLAPLLADSGHSYHRVLGQPSAEGSLSHNPVCQCPKDHSVPSDFEQLINFSKSALQS